MREIVPNQCILVIVASKDQTLSIIASDWEESVAIHTGTDTK